MQFVEEVLPGTWRVKLKSFADDRGIFVKTYVRSVFAAAGIAFDFHEEFYSISRKDVVRGMHFQLPPHDHVKIVYCAVGVVEDVVLDLRKGVNYGAFRSVLLRADEPEMLIVPIGIAHGFKSLTDNSLMVYKTSAEHAPQHDCGIRWDSFGFDWGEGEPIISARDRAHPALADFSSPF